MPEAPHTTPAARRPWWAVIATHRLGIPLFVLALTAGRIAWMVWFSRYTLVEDEAHYWEWSRHPAWSYYSKGPGVAWAIAASTALFGHVEWAVRLPAALASGIGSLAAAALTRTLFSRPGAPFVAAVLYQCVPPLAVTSVLMTIDGPFVACWTLAAWGAARALVAQRPSGWLLMGLGVGVGFLFKYTILLLVPGVALAVLISPSCRAAARRQAPMLAAGLALAAAGLVPVLLWNAQQGWPTVRHLLGHLGLPGGDTQPSPGTSWSPLWTLEYLGVLLAMGGPAAWLGLVAWFERRRAGEGLWFAWACAAPIAASYLVVSFFTRTEGNWAIAAAATLVAPAAWLVVDGVLRRDTIVRWLWGGALVVGVGVHAAFATLPTLSRVGRMGAQIPVERLTGMREHAAAVQEQIDALRDQTGLEPFVMSSHYGRASLLSFYLPGRPTVYGATSQLGGRRTQYDHWPHTDLSNPEVIAPLLGRPAVLMGREAARWAGAFDSVVEIGPLRAEPKDDRTTCIGLGFRGFDAPEEALP